MYAGIHLFFK